MGGSRKKKEGGKRREEEEKEREEEEKGREEEEAGKEEKGKIEEEGGLGAKKSKEKRREEILENAWKRFEEEFSVEREEERILKLVNRMKGKYFKQLKIGKEEYFLFTKPNVHQISEENNALFSVPKNTLTITSIISKTCIRINSFI